MSYKIVKIAFGGGCHWCTEAVFQSLKGVECVEQGFVGSTGDNEYLSEAVIVHFDTKKIKLETLIKVYLHTHKSTSNHSMRIKYRSAIYTYSETQKLSIEIIMTDLQNNFHHKIITKVLPFKVFTPSREAIQNYYIKNKNKPFCKRFINPKLTLLLKKFSDSVDTEQLNHFYHEKHEIKYTQFSCY